MGKSGAGSPAAGGGGGPARVEPAVPATEQVPAPPDTTGTPEPPAAAVPDDTAPELSTRDRVRQAYDELTRAPGDWVSLTDLRRKLAGLPAREVDQVLKDLDGQGAVLIPEANQKTLRPEDRAAALNIGGEEQHLIAFEDR
jgi:hypothetical protein